MKLHEIIEKILISEHAPMTAAQIARKSSARELNFPSGTIDFSSPQIQDCVNNFPSLFHNIGGWIVLASDRKWQEILDSYWYIVNILRGIYGNAELQYVVSALFLYKRCIDWHTQPYWEILQNRRMLLKRFNAGDVGRNWLVDIELLDDSDSSSFPIFSELRVLLRRLDERTIEDISVVLERVETRSFTVLEFGILYEHIVEINVSENYRSGLIRTPRSIIELMIEILNPQYGVVYDPVCGVGGLLTEIHRHNNTDLVLKGTEINFGAALLAYMNLILNDSRTPNIVATNCFTELSISDTYDYIVGDLPLSGIPNSPIFHEAANYFGLKFPKEGRGFSPMLLLVIAKLNRRGKAVVTVSDSFLSAGGIDERMRRLLIQEDLIECVVSLPSNILRPYTNGKASLLVLNRVKPSYLHNRIKFIDASAPSFKAQAIDILKIAQDYRDRTTDAKRVQIVSLDSVLGSGTLQVAFYTEKFHEVDELLRAGRAALLSDLVEVKRGVDLLQKDSADNLEGIPYIRIENLEKDILDMYLSSENLVNHVIETDPYLKAYFSEEVILIARVGDHLKPTYFKPSRSVPAIIAHANVIILRPVGLHEISLEYLYYQLYSSFIQRQVEQKRKGAVMPFIGIKELGKLLIPLMPLSAQRDFVSTQKATIIAAERERVNQRLKLAGLEEQSMQKESDIVSTLVHELRPKLVSISTVTSKVKRIIDKHNLSKLAEYDELIDDVSPELAEFAEPLENLNLKILCDKLERDSLHLNDTLSDVQKVMGFALKPEDFTEEDLRLFLLEYFETKKIEIAGRYQYEIKGSSVKIEINANSFKHVIDQLLLNAEKHGFSSPTLNDKVTFTIRENKTRRIAVLDYSNNGTQFALSEQEFIGFFRKSKDSNGSGIGGNFIYRVIKAHGGDLKILENPKRGFAMRIEFPLRRSEYE